MIQQSFGIQLNNYYIYNMESINSKTYQGRIYETKDSFVVESVISEKSVSIQDPSNFINKQLKEYDGKNVKVEVIIKVTEL
jgi:uncharacterized protein YxjI